MPACILIYVCGLESCAGYTNEGSGRGPGHKLGWYGDFLFLRIRNQGKQNSIGIDYHNTMSTERSRFYFILRSRRIGLDMAWTLRAGLFVHRWHTASSYVCSR
jgi:hypothetical protein